MNKELFHSQPKAENFEDRIFDFLELSQKMLNLVKHENAILESCGFANIEAYVEQRSALFKSYEENAKNLIDDVISENVHVDAHTILVSELSAVQSALADNATYGFNSIPNSLSYKDGESKWH